jgi:predicted AAA+ superfamily ATPase
MWIERQISESLRRAAATFPVVVLVGPRQVGKTSLLERAFPDLECVSLDLPSVAEMAETLPDRFLAEHPPPVLIDEVQYAPGLFRHLKARVEAERGRNGMFLLTGSQNFVLMERVSDSLAGRAAVLPFLGLSGGEWGASPPLRDRFGWHDFVWRGGYPGLWATPDVPPERDRWYQGYVATYLERDVRNLLRVGSLRDFDRFLRACAFRTAQILNLSDLGRDVGISPSTAREWLGVLQASNQVVLLEPYHRSLGKRLVKSPKLYFTDTGLASYLLGFQSPAGLWNGPLAGAMWENHVVGQWIRWRDWLRPSASLWFWQDRSGAEVDLVIDLDTRLVAIECRRTERPGPADAKGIRKMRDFYGREAVAGAYIACTASSSFQIEEGLEARPGWTAWDQELMSLGAP